MKKYIFRYTLIYNTQVSLRFIHFDICIYLYISLYIHIFYNMRELRYG